MSKRRPRTADEINMERQRLYKALRKCDGTGIDPDSPREAHARYLREFHRAEGFAWGLSWVLGRRGRRSAADLHRLRDISKGVSTTKPLANALLDEDPDFWKGIGLKREKGR